MVGQLDCVTSGVHLQRLQLTREQQKLYMATAAALHPWKVTGGGCTYQSAEHFAPADHSCLQLSSSQQCVTGIEALRL